MPLSLQHTRAISTVCRESVVTQLLLLLLYCGWRARFFFFFFFFSIVFFSPSSALSTVPEGGFIFMSLKQKGVGRVVGR